MAEWTDRCPVCGEFLDYCMGHGESDDPVGFEIGERHDAGDHTRCHVLSDCRHRTFWDAARSESWCETCQTIADYCREYPAVPLVGE